MVEGRELIAIGGRDDFGSVEGCEFVGRRMDFSMDLVGFETGRHDLNPE